ncbi:SigE family RNA polymerase sigma factor [Cryptosporangium aurantiacum]|uniref:RNA polymerase sigma-70 factor, sigma-E family n=1 Tax=Cryptosporangium aurantiacum TaxID=134849 RepID=A0A1M7RIY3_9ACTN|nr:SigE family RNA polymerase sigma factor [Cryptosporangium aurantiacum]SHN46166.1 RNA polymerase sigma-70 factor, sigma-E family [Cryptosporangium aurantiacum]
MKPDGESFDSYVAADGAALLRFTYVLTGDHHLAEDLVQEALVKVHRRWDRIRRVEQPGPYVRKAVLRQYLSWRRRRSSSEVPAMDAVGPEPVSRDPADALVDRDALGTLLATLPRRQRAVLFLRFYEDLDDTAIGELLGCSPATVRGHASRGLARLRVSAQASVVGNRRPS